MKNSLSPSPSPVRHPIFDAWHDISAVWYGVFMQSLMTVWGGQA
jgi:hypothetical protein